MSADNHILSPVVKKLAKFQTEESCFYQSQRLNMSKSTRSSAQRSRPASPYEEDVVEILEELPSSEHEEDPEVSFHPANPTIIYKPSWSTSTDGRDVYALYRRSTHGLDSQ